MRQIPDDVKTNTAEECYNPNGMIPSLISEIKEKYGMNVNVWTDVALDPYSDQGHDGMVSNDKRGDGGMGRIMNDETIEQLCRQAVAQARAGADTVAPSDMMDGRIGAIRDALDSEGFTDTSIVAYTVPRRAAQRRGSAACPRRPPPPPPHPSHRAALTAAGAAGQVRVGILRPVPRRARLRAARVV